MPAWRHLDTWTSCWPMPDFSRHTATLGSAKKRDMAPGHRYGPWRNMAHGPCCHPPMIQRGQGCAIVLTSSTSGLEALDGGDGVAFESYTAAKHGVVGLSVLLSAQLV